MGYEMMELSIMNSDDFAFGEYAASRTECSGPGGDPSCRFREFFLEETQFFGKNDTGVVKRYGLIVHIIPWFLRIYGIFFVSKNANYC